MVARRALRHLGNFRVVAQLRSPPAGVDAVKTLTIKGDSDENYLAGIKRNTAARKVKIADMLANLSDAPTAKQIIRYARGLLALHDE